MLTSKVTPHISKDTEDSSPVSSRLVCPSWEKTATLQGQTQECAQQGKCLMGWAGILQRVCDSLHQVERAGTHLLV
ncbi:Protein Daple [Manis pentadactyla]|nr:Protein Daple [Manis pentadactyla]